MVNPSITSDASNAPITLPEIVVTAPPPSGAGTTSNNPQDIIKPITGGAGGELLIYPADRPKYYLQFDIYNYSRQDLMTIGKLGNSLGTIVLPLPSQIVDHNQEAWQDNYNVGQLTGAAVQNMLLPTVNSVIDQGLVDSSLLALRKFSNNVINIAGMTFEQWKQAADTGGGIVAASTKLGSALLGYAPNQFLTILFVSPVYKRHEFVWSFAPHTKQEADILRRIANKFKNSMAPNIALGGLLFKFPKIFWMSFHPNSRMLYKFKPAVMESFAVNYTPSGRAAFFKDPNPGAGENAPATMTISMRLLELEYWMEGDHNDTNLPENVYTHGVVGLPNISDLGGINK